MDNRTEPSSRARAHVAAGVQYFTACLFFQDAHHPRALTCREGDGFLKFFPPGVPPAFYIGADDTRIYYLRYRFNLIDILSCYLFKS